MIKVVVAAVVFNSQRVLLVKQVNKDLWVPPGGHVEQGETLGEALRRELFEETNLIATFCESSPKHILPNWESDPTPFLVQTKPDKSKGRCTQLEYAGIVHDPSKLRIQEKELSAAKWFLVNDVPTSPDIHESVKERILLALKFLEQHKLLNIKLRAK